MTLHDDGTMDVRVDGALERRTFTMSRSPGDFDLSGHYIGRGICSPEPVLRDHEMVIHIIGDGVPVIVRTRQ